MNSFTASREETCGFSEDDKIGCMDEQRNGL